MEGAPVRAAPDHLRQDLGKQMRCWPERRLATGATSCFPFLAPRARSADCFDLADSSFDKLSLGGQAFPHFSASRCDIIIHKFTVGTSFGLRSLARRKRRGWKERSGLRTWRGKLVGGRDAVTRRKRLQRRKSGMNGRVGGRESRRLRVARRKMGRRVIQRMELKALNRDFPRFRGTVSGNQKWRGAMGHRLEAHVREMVGRRK